jgi:CheY-like chemotaxis protein
MAKGFAEQSGGALRLASTPGEGTTVTLWLPEGQPDLGLPLPGPAAGVGEGRLPQGRPRVLLVDDEPLVRGLLADELAHRGWPVTQAAGGADALALLDGPEGARFDLLVTGLSMPGMDGLALIREARRRRPGRPALVVTGHAHEAEALGGLPEGGGPVALLRKPIGGAELAERARLVLAVEPAAE